MTLAFHLARLIELDFYQILCLLRFVVGVVITFFSYLITVVNIFGGK